MKVLMKNELVEKLKLMPKKERSNLIAHIKQLENLDIMSKEAQAFIENIKTVDNQINVVKLNKKYRMLFAMKHEGNEPHLLILDCIPTDKQRYSYLA